MIFFNDFHRSLSINQVYLSHSTRNFFDLITRIGKQFYIRYRTLTVDHVFIERLTTVSMLFNYFYVNINFLSKFICKSGFILSIVILNGDLYKIKQYQRNFLLIKVEKFKINCSIAFLFMLRGFNAFVFQK